MESIQDRYWKETLETGVPTKKLLFRDFGVNSECEYLIESGCHLGDGIDGALECGFKKVLSCDIEKKYVDHCINRFRNSENVTIWLGASETCLQEMIHRTNGEKICFWLDGHGPGKSHPILEELKIIKDAGITDATIVIDDIPTYYGWYDSENGEAMLKERPEDIEESIREINENYLIEYFPVNLGRRCNDWILVAHF